MVYISGYPISYKQSRYARHIDFIRPYCPTYICGHAYYAFTFRPAIFGVTYGEGHPCSISRFVPPPPYQHTLTYPHCPDRPSFYKTIESRRPRHDPLTMRVVSFRDIRRCRTTAGKAQAQAGSGDTRERCVYLVWMFPKP